MTQALLALNRRTFASLQRHRNYRLFFMGQVISLAGTWMQNIALAWYIVELTHSPLAVGGLAFCRFAPFMVFGLVSGVVADRFDNRRLVIGTQLAQMAVSVLLTALAFSGWDSVAAAYVLALAGGTAMVLDAPGRQALTYQMVGRDELPNAIALNAGLFNGARIIGPAIAGVLIAAAGVGACFAVNTVTFLAVLTALLLMRPSELFALDRTDERPTLLAGVREGIAYARATPQIRVALIVLAVVSTIRLNFHVILPLLVAETLRAGPEVLGLLGSTFGAGALAGALLSASLGRASWKALVAGLAGFGFASLALAPVESAAAAAAILVFAGGAFTLWISNTNSTLQLTAPDALRGRVMSLFMFAFAGLAPIGGLFAGWLVDVGGTRLAFSVAGVTAIAFSGYAWMRRPQAVARAAATAHAEAEARGEARAEFRERAA